MVGKALVLASAILLVAILAPALVSAQQPVPNLSMEFESDADLGEGIQISASLLDPAGDPISGVQIVFYLDTEFMNTAGRMEIGFANTDARGRALITYIPKRDGENVTIARFAGNADFAPAEDSGTLRVAPGAATFVQEAPFRMPGANIYTVVMAVAFIWGAFILVIGLFWLISRKGAVEDVELSGGGW